MTETRTDLVPARPPTDVADAIDMAARLDALRDLATERRDWIRKVWLVDLAKRTSEVVGSGAAFRAPVPGVGTAYITKPEPGLRVVDVEAFARWYVADLLDDDPDADPDHDRGWGNGRVLRRRVAEVKPSDVLVFHDRTRDPSDLEVAAIDLRAAIDVRVEWLLSDGILDELTAKPPTVRIANDKPVDAEGTIIPGLAVTPAGTPVPTIKPDTDYRRQVRAELDAIVGPVIPQPDEGAS